MNYLWRACALPYISTNNEYRSFVDSFSRLSTVAATLPGYPRIIRMCVSVCVRARAHAPACTRALPIHGQLHRMDFLIAGRAYASRAGARTGGWLVIAHVRSSPGSGDPESSNGPSNYASVRIYTHTHTHSVYRQKRITVVDGKADDDAPRAIDKNRRIALAAGGRLPSRRVRRGARLWLPSTYSIIHPDASLRPALVSRLNEAQSGRGTEADTPRRASIKTSEIRETWLEYQRQSMEKKNT